MKRLNSLACGALLMLSAAAAAATPTKPAVKAAAMKPIRGAKASPAAARAAVAKAKLTRTAKPKDAYHKLRKSSVAVYDLPATLRPFVATCERKKTRFSKLFCTALNDRLKAQHQSKLYRYAVKASAVGPSANVTIIAAKIEHSRAACALTG